MEYTTQSKVVQLKNFKDWGYELVIENNEKYCGKLLVFKKDASFLMQYHKLKDKTWYIQSGEFNYKGIDINNGGVFDEFLKTGDIIRHLAGQPHQLTALTDGTIFEVSTTHYDDDSYKISIDNTESPTDKSNSSDRGHVYHTLNNKIIDLRGIDYNLSQHDVEVKYGWEACMYWSNIYYHELDNDFFKVEKGDIFLDLGANIGMSATYAELKGASKIYAIEPDPNIYECLKKNSGPNWTIDNVGVSDHDGVFLMGYWPDTRNLFSADCLTLDSLFNKYLIEKIDYLKMDIEGSEFDVVASTSRDTWDKIKKMFIEYHEDPHDTSGERRHKFIQMISDGGFINSHISLGTHQTFMYFWK